MRKLSEVKDKIIWEHGRKGKLNADILEDEAFKLFVLRLAEMEPEKIEAYAKLISEDNLQGLVSYVVINKYNVKPNNLFKVIDLKADRGQLLQVFYDWENNHMRGKTARPFLADLVKNNSELRGQLDDIYIDLDKITWLENDDYIRTICSGSKFSNKEDFTNELSEKGVIKDTALYDSCLTELIIYCDRETYIALGDSEVAKLFMQLKSLEQRVKFCLNYTSKFDIKYLFSAKAVSGKVHSLYEDSSQNEYLLSELESSGLKGKFEDWMKHYGVEAFIGSADPRRAKFWPNYIGKNTAFEKNSFALCIHFDGYVVIEYVEKAAGPAYLMTQEYYDNPKNQIKSKFENAIYKEKSGIDTTPIYKQMRELLIEQWRAKERGNSRYAGLIQRMPHQDGQFKQHPWEGMFEGWLSEVGIRSIW